MGKAQELISLVEVNNELSKALILISILEGMSNLGNNAVFSLFITPNDGKQVPKNTIEKFIVGLSEILSRTIGELYFKKYIRIAYKRGKLLILVRNNCPGGVLNWIMKIDPHFNRDSDFGKLDSIKSIEQEVGASVNLFTKDRDKLRSLISKLKY